MVVALGQTATDHFLRAWRDTGHAVPRPKPTFGHARAHRLDDVDLVTSYHPSQRNTQTGLLREDMFDQVFRMAKTMLDRGRTETPSGPPTKRRP